MRRVNLKNKQSGMATMIISLVLLVSIGLMSIYTAQVSVMDQRISANLYRAKQAFEAAQAGLDNAIYNLNMSIVNNAICTGSGTEVRPDSLCLNLNNPLGEGDASAFTGNSGLTTLATDFSAGQTVGNYTMSFRQHSTYPNMVSFTLQGYAGDNAVSNGNSNIRITQNLIKTPIISYHPPAPIIAIGNIDVSDSGIYIKNEFPDTLAAFWVGGSSSITGANIDVTTASGEVGGYYDNQADLSGLSTDDFFENFFSETKANFKKRATVVECLSNCTQTDLSAYVDAAGNPTANNIIWVNANNSGAYTTLNIGGSIDFGTVANPMILIVDGKFVLNDSNANFVGVVYTTQNFGQGSNDGKITGSLLTEGKIESGSVAGRLDFIYDNSMFDNMDADIARFTRVAGSWKDF